MTDTADQLSKERLRNIVLRLNVICAECDALEKELPQDGYDIHYGFPKFANQARNYRDKYKALYADILMEEEDGKNTK